MKTLLYKRLFIGFFLVALVPFFILLYYTYEQNRAALVQKAHFIHSKKLEQMKLLIFQDMNEIQREAAFISSLPIMDDIISNDIDKRIMELIEKKRDVFKLKTNITVYDTKHNRMAQALSVNEVNESLSFDYPINASFNPAMPLGSITIELPYKSLEYYLAGMMNDWCFKKADQIVAGACESESAMIVSSELGMGELIIQMEIAKASLLEPLEALRYQLIALAVFSFLAFMALFFIVIKIISKPIAQNDELQKMQIRLLETSKHAAEAKSRFISQMSHEFRTPLNSIIGFSQFLTQEKLVEQEYETLPQKIEKAGKHLLETINKILDFAKAEHEALTLKPGTLDLKALVENSVEMLESQAKAKSLQLTCKCDPCRIISDENMLKSILINLIANAIKFTHKGEVNVTLHVNDSVKISVKDTGIGIQKAQSKRLFQPFNRLEGSKNIEGSGLGLALCSAYAKQLGIKLYHVYHDIGSEFVIEMEKPT